MKRIVRKERSNLFSTLFFVFVFFIVASNFWGNSFERKDGENVFGYANRGGGFSGGQRYYSDNVNRADWCVTGREPFSVCRSYQSFGYNDYGKVWGGAGGRSFWR